MDQDPTATPTEPVIRTIAMPADTNPSGDIFGGWLMGQMDLAAGNAAARRARGRCSTVAVDGMVFHRPVMVGDEVSLYATLLRVGRTSMRISVEAWRRSREDRWIGGVCGGLADLSGVQAAIAAADEQSEKRINDIITRQLGIGA